MNDSVNQTISERPRRNKSPDFRTTVLRFPVTYGTIVITLIVFLLQWLSAFANGNNLICGPEDVICQAGAKVNWAIAAGEIWRFFTPIFIHANAGHIFVNMYSLYAVGPSVELFYGRERTAIVYLLSGVSGVAFSLAFNANNSVGASGAIFGIVGALAWFLYRHRDLFGAVAKDQLRRIVVVIALNLALGFSTMIDNWGHIGGLLGGLLIGWFIGPHLVRSQTLDQPNRLVDSRPWGEVVSNSLFAVVVVAICCLAAIFSPFNQH